jgi:hypothetical protein
MCLAIGYAFVFALAAWAAPAHPGGLTAGDVIVHDGLSGAQQVSLFGIKYHQNNATTGTWLSLNRATYPVQLATPRVNAALPSAR